MQTVPTTPTATDKLEEVRKLNGEITLLKSAKDIADRAAREAQESAAESLKRSRELEKRISQLEKGMTDASVEIREFVANCRNILQGVVSTMEVASQAAKLLAARVDELVAEITKLEQSKKELLESMSRENELISAQRADLDIYHARILKAAGEHLPGQKITIQKTL